VIGISKDRIAEIRAAFDRKLEGRRRLVAGVATLILCVGGVLIYAVRLNESYAIEDWLFWKIAVLWLYGALLAAACASCGFALLSRLRTPGSLPFVETVTTSVGLGLVCFTFGMYLGGALGLYGPWFALLLPGVLCAAGARGLGRYLWDSYRQWQQRPQRPTNPIVIAACAWGGLCVAIVYFGALTPDAIGFDPAWYHLPIAQDYARHGGIIPFADYNRAFPHLASLVHTWAYTVPGLSTPLRWMLALHNEFFFFVWTLAGVGAVARWLLDEGSLPGAWAGLFLFPGILVHDIHIAGGADHFLAFFAPILFLATVRAIEDFSIRNCAIVGIVAGGAALTKYQAIYMIGGSGALIAVSWLRQVVAARSQGRAVSQVLRGPLVTGAATIIVVGLLVTAPHFLKNIVFYNNPVYPFAQDVFTGSTPSVPDAAEFVRTVFQEERWQPKGDLGARLSNAVKLFFTFSFEPHYSRTKNFPIIGSLFTLLLPSLLFLAKPRRLWLAVAWCFVGIVVWGSTYLVDRYLVSIVPLMAAATVVILIRLWRFGWIARVGIIPLVALQVVWAGDATVYSNMHRLKSSMALVNSGYAGNTDAVFANYRSAYRKLSDALPQDARVVLHSARLCLGIDRDLTYDITGAQGLISYAGIAGPRELYDYYRSLGFTHLVYTPNNRPGMVRQANILFLELVHHYGLNPTNFGGYRLVELPQTPPPDDSGYDVLMLGMGGYRDGLYPVESLSTAQKGSSSHQTFADPLIETAADDPKLVELLHQVRAVVVRGSVPPAISVALRHRFMVAARYSRKHTVYILKKAYLSPEQEPGEQQ
jgi:hypothetical protein